MIKISECRLIGADGTQFGVVSMEQAFEIANKEGLDLVELSPNAVPPVVKVIDYGKYKYEQQKKANIAKKKQVVVQLKEIQFRPNIEAHDLETKLKQGDKIKMVMRFRGREMAYKEAGLEKFNGIVESVISLGALVESPAKLIGSRIIAIVAPSAQKVK